MSGGVAVRPLAAGYAVPRVINGAWQLAADHGGSVEPRQAVEALLPLVDAGFGTFDCADIYTGVETLLGRLIRVHRRRTSSVPICIHTKLVPDQSALPTLDRAYVTRVVDRSLQRLGVEHLDLVQLHWWDYGVPGMIEAAGHLDDLRRGGKIRHLGVTNFDVEHLGRLVGAGIPIVSHQVQYSLLDRRPATAMAAFCQQHDIQLLAYGSLAGGFLADSYCGVPAPASLTNRSLVKYRLIIDECGGWSALQRALATVQAVARRHGVSVASVATRWVLDQRQVAATIVGSRHAGHLAARQAMLSLQFDADDRARLVQALDHLPSPAGPVYGLERTADGPHARIMKTELNQAGR